MIKHIVIKMSSIFILAIIIGCDLSLGSSANRGHPLVKKEYSLEKELLQYSYDPCAQDSLLGIDTIVRFDDWENEGYTKIEKIWGTYTKKSIQYNTYLIEISQMWIKQGDLYKQRRLVVNKRDLKLERTYKLKFKRKLSDQYYLMNNKISAKKYPKTIQIDFVMPYHNCCCDSCNEVLILSLIILKSNGYLKIELHEEDLEKYCV